MKKYLDILIFSLLFFLLFSYFQGSKETPNMSGLQFSTVKSSYTVPAGVVLEFANHTAEKIQFNTCETLSLRYAGELRALPKTLCQDVALKPQETKNIDLSEYYELFSDTGNYIFEFQHGDKKLITQLQIKYRGTIGKIFVGVFYAPIYNLMAFLIQLLHNSLGLAILVITIIIRILLLFPQHKMMVSQRKMQAIQPKIKKLQETYKGNQQQMGMELMKLYKKEGVNPMGSCGFLLIQMPILLVIYNIIMNITSLKNAFYLYPSLSAFHVSQIDFSFFGLNLLSSGGIAGICLALFVAGIQYIQVRLSLAHKITTDTKKGEVVLEKKKDAGGYNSLMPDPDMMNKFMLYGMPAMVGVFTYTLAAGVGLYWGMSTLFAIFQQLFVNKIIKSK